MIRFGDDFELDPTAYELRRGGRVLKLERIPMEILLLLIERRDRLVSREEIVERIWGGGVFVETDNAINVAIRKIRSVLGDEPENPRFIRTVTGKGYRFIAPLVEPEAAVVRSLPHAKSRWPVVLGASVLLLGVLAYLVWPRHSAPRASTGAPVMLAVLPFENLTGDPAQEYFSDGMTEEMIAHLGSLAPERLGVIARTSIMHYKNSPEPLSKVGSELQVQYVLEGSVRRSPESLRITAQLIRLEDQTHLWARQYDRSPADLLHVQQEIATAVADEIQLTLGDKTRPPRGATLTASELAAYDAYLAGRFAWNKRTPDGFRQAISFFEQALAAKPDYAQAYAGLADCYTLMSSYGIVAPAEGIPKARAAALRALEIDPELAAAHASLAVIQENYEFDWQAAEAGFKRARELDPNYATARHWYAEFLGFQGRFGEALEEIERARQLDPLSTIVAADRGAILLFARRYDDAVRQFQAVLAVDPALGRAHLIVEAYALQGRYAEALADLAEWRKLDPGPWQAAWTAHVQGRAGRAAEAEVALREIEVVSRRVPLDLTWPYAVAYLGMGKEDDAFVWLQRMCAQRSYLTALRVDPVLDPVRDDARFQELLRCAHLERGASR